MYSDKPAALAVVKSEAGISDDLRDVVLNNLLDSTAGTIAEVTEYRPHLVAALAMHSSKKEQTVTEASGAAKFRQTGETMNLQPAIAGQLEIQQGIDTQQGTIVPPGWDVATQLKKMCGCKSFDETSETTEKKYVFGAVVA